jgi:hypothetical protein
MPINHRPMGERTGIWTGLEIEHTEFYGLETIFYSRFSTLTTYPHFALRQDDGVPDFDHVFIAPINPKFFDGESSGTKADFSKIVEMAKYFFSHNKKVTIEVSTQQPVELFTELRRSYSNDFCLLLVIELPELELRGFAVKVAPPVVFEDRANERAVLTAATWKFKATKWSEYGIDQDMEIASMD